MKKTKRKSPSYLFIATCLLVAAIYSYWVHFFDAENRTPLTQIKNRVEDTQKPSPKNSFTPVEISNTSKKIDSPIKLEKRNLKTAQLKHWLKKESLAVDHPSINTENKIQYLTSKAKDLTKMESQFLVQSALSSSTSANEKLLAVYLLTLGRLTTLNQIVSFISAPMDQIPQFDGDHGPGQTKRVQESALRIMAIDNLYELAKTDSNAYQKLIDLVSTISDPVLQKYAKNKLQQINR